MYKHNMMLINVDEARTTCDYVTHVFTFDRRATHADVMSIYANARILYGDTRIHVFIDDEFPCDVILRIFDDVFDMRDYNDHQ